MILRFSEGVNGLGIFYWPPLQRPSPRRRRRRGRHWTTWADGPWARPILNATNPFQTGGSPIDPLALYFRGGAPIGGPFSALRGVPAIREPNYAAIGAPIGDWRFSGPGLPIKGGF